VATTSPPSSPVTTTPSPVTTTPPLTSVPSGGP
jgi:hypothetical protein